MEYSRWQCNVLKKKRIRFPLVLHHKSIEAME